MRAAPTHFDRPTGQRLRLIGELSERDLELLIDLAQRWKAG